MDSKNKAPLIACLFPLIVFSIFLAYLMAIQVPELVQPPLDTSKTRISVSESKLFSNATLLNGTRHIINDSSFMKGCEIKKISYTEYNYFHDSTDSYKKDIPGTQASFVMAYSCNGLNSRTASMAPADSIEWRLMYDPSASKDGTGWRTMSHGNG